MFKSSSLNYANISGFIKPNIQSFNTIYFASGQECKDKSHFFEIWQLPNFERGLILQMIH